MWPQMALRTLADQMHRHRRLVPMHLNSTDKYLSHPATYFHLGQGSSRRGIPQDVQFGLADAENLPPDDAAEEPEQIATQLEFEPTEEGDTPSSTSRASAGARSSSRYASWAASSSSGRR